jgi:YceI-like domain
MNMRRASVAATIAVALAIAAARIGAYAATSDTAGSPAGVGLGAGSSLWFEGKSNLHAFEGRSSEVTVALTCDSTAQKPRDAASLESFVRSAAVRGLDLRVPVMSLRSEKSGLDKNMWKDLKADKFPAIQFHLTHYSLAPHAASGDTLEIHAEGTLNIAGRERPITLVGHAHGDAGGVWLDGFRGLRMTDYDIQPPTMMLGTLRVADSVTVRYHLLLVPGTPTETASPSRTN